MVADGGCSYMAMVVAVRGVDNRSYTNTGE
jgi:hypothetical protein